jgi:hypothetical protein
MPRGSRGVSRIAKNAELQKTAVELAHSRCTWTDAEYGQTLGDHPTPPELGVCSKLFAHTIFKPPAEHSDFALSSRAHTWTIGFRLISLHSYRLLLAPRNGNIVAILHPHQRLHLDAKSLFESQSHLT